MSSRRSRVTRSWRCRRRKRSGPTRSAPRDRLDDMVAVDALHRVGDREAGHGGIGSGSHRADHGLEQRRRRQRSRGVVHDDNRGGASDGVQTRAHRRRARRSAGDECSHWTAVPRDTGREDEHDVVARLGNGVDGAVDEAGAGDGLELLRHAVATPGAGGDDDAAGPATAVHAVRMAPGTRGRLYFPSAWSSRPSAASSFTLSAKVSSETRIWRALASMRFSPADRPLSFSRIDRFRTTSATW